MISFPLSRSQFWSLLPVANMTMPLPGAAKSPRTRGGELLPAEYGTRLWEGEVEIGTLTLDEYRQVTPLIHLLLTAGASFFIDDKGRRGGPWSDPSGARLAGSAPVIDTVVNARELTIKSLPANYVISAGDRMTFTAGSLTHFHEVVVGKTADADGLTGAIEVMPPIRPGVTAGRPLTLHSPYMRAVIVPDSYQPPSRSGGSSFYRGGSFAWRQSLR